MRQDYPFPPPNEKQETKEEVERRGGQTGKAEAYDKSMCGIAAVAAAGRDGQDKHQQQ